jgi:hypothetical protein
MRWLFLEVGYFHNAWDRELRQEDLVRRPRQDLWPVEMDPSQIDQILANLCVNASDAISGNGKTAIETSNQTFNQDYCRMYRGFIMALLTSTTYQELSPYRFAELSPSFF